MGEENNNSNNPDNDLEGRISRIAKFPLRFIRNNAASIGVSVGIGAAYIAYLAIKHDKAPDFSKIKDAFADWDYWKGVAAWTGVGTAGVLASFAGFLKLKNWKRKRQGKEPINIPKYFQTMFLPWTVGKSEKDYLERKDQAPLPSAACIDLARFYFKEGRIIEAMEAYYQALKEMDDNFVPKIPVYGTTAFLNPTSSRIRKLEERLNQNPEDNGALLELAMCHLSLNNIDKASECVERIKKEQDPISLRIIISRFYSKASERVKMPRVRRLSFGTSKLGMAADKTIYFWDNWRKPRSNVLMRRADRAAEIAVEDIFERKDIGDYLQRIGDYPVYRIHLNGLVKGFVVAKEGEYDELTKEMENERCFERIVATDRFKSVHPVTIIKRGNKHYLILLYEEGTPLAESTNPEHYMETAKFAARSDALMPISDEAVADYMPAAHFEWRVFSSELPEDAQQRLIENSGFMFKYSGRFPVVFDGDWRADGNCLINCEGYPIALDKQDKGGTIGPVTIARCLNQGTMLEDEVKDGIAEECYVASYQDLASNGRRMDEPELVLPVSATATIEKAITSWCFTENRPSQQLATQIFVKKALHEVKRVCQDSKMHDFYSDDERIQCRTVGEIIYEHLLTTVP